MNKTRRMQIDEVIAKLEEAKEILEVLGEEEQEYLDNMPESLQMSEKGDKAQEAIDNLEGAVSSLEEAIEYATSATD